MKKIRPSKVPSTLIVDAAPKGVARVKSAGRVLRVLEFFDEVRREATSCEISERLEIPQSSTSFLLRCMHEMGFLDYNPRGRLYIPSPRVSMLGQWLTHGPVRDGNLSRAMTELSDLTGQTVMVAMRNGIFAQYISVVQATKPLRIHIPVGTRRTLAWSSAGFCLLSGAPDDEIPLIVRRTNAEVSTGNACRLKDVLSNVEFVRRNGYFYSPALVTPGTGAISMPLPGNKPLALCLAGWLDTFEQEKRHYVELMRSVISQHLVEPRRKNSFRAIPRRQARMERNARLENLQA